MKPFTHRQISFWVLSCALIISGTVQELRASGLTIAQVAGLPGYVTNDLGVMTTAGESVGAMNMWLRLNAGAIFQDANGGNTPPDPILLSLDPTLAFDSYVNGFIGGTSNGLGSPNSGGPVVMNTTTVDALWGPPLGYDPGNATNYFAARMTLSNAANGLMSFSADTSGNSDFRGEYLVRNGVITPVPEPASLALMALALANACYFVRRRTQ